MKTHSIISKKFSGAIAFFLLLSLGFSLNQAVYGQYFGKNKPGYKVFDYDVLRTPNFDIYHNFKNDSVVSELGAMSEYWYKAHSTVFGDSLSSSNPMIFYENHADFQQTNVASDIIGIGTGGFTEGFKNRVVMPVSITRSQTNHVLGHELVHAFQYNMMSTDSLTLQNMSNIPLWMIEGLAEYMSIGSIDPQTSMWMRDAILNKKFPTLDDMSKKPEYNPYRYGQAFWTFTAKTWGDTIIKPLFVTTAKIGIKAAIDTVLGVEMKTLSKMWKDSSEKHFKTIMKDSVDSMTGTKLISEDNAGEMNISPVVSPDGKYVAFMSEKNLFSIDLYIADTETGKIKSKLASTVRNDEIDDFNWLESSGAWSPDSRKLAYVIFTKGENRLIIIDVRKNKILKEISMQGVNEFSNPTWSPDGNNIVFSGNRRGLSNLYEYNLNSEELVQLTENGFSYIHPNWSPDGKHIVFSTDKNALTGKLSKGYVINAFNLGIMNVKTGETQILNVFPGAGNLNPVFSEDGKSIYFLSDRDGFRNLYRYSIEESKVFQLTHYLTGISGITMLSPALSVVGDYVVYSYYSNRKYSIYKAKTSDFTEEEVNPFLLTYDASTLPPLERNGGNIVDYMLLKQPEIQNELKSESGDEFKPVSYKPKFQLDYISNVNAGVSTSRIGGGMAGSVAAIFSDMVGNNKILAVLALNGEIYDFGGQVAYLNEKNRLKWGATVSHIPYLFGYREFIQDSLEIEGEKHPVINGALNINRLFESQVSVFGYVPFSITRRIESGISLSRYYYRLDRYNFYYDQNGYYIGQSKEKQDAPPGFTMVKGDIAYVYDNSNFGVTSPMQGARARYGVTAYTGTYNFFSTLVDYRKYFFAKPVTFAFRFFNSNRLGKDANVFTPEYLGYPWLIRGYDGSSGSEASNLTIDQMVGTRMVVSNAEIRIPFTGPRRLSLIKSKFLFTDLAFFADAGLIWDKEHNPELKWQSSSVNERIPLISVGASLRINLFGYIIIEPYYAVPFQNGGWENANFGLNFVPGW